MQLLVNDFKDPDKILFVITTQSKNLAHKEKAVTTVFGISKVLELVCPGFLVQVDVTGSLCIVVERAFE
jgi:low temperature requirement protein LtrA